MENAANPVWFATNWPNTVPAEANLTISALAFAGPAPIAAEVRNFFTRELPGPVTKTCTGDGAWPDSWPNEVPPLASKLKKCPEPSSPMGWMCS